MLITPDLLLQAYATGYFPMGEPETGEIRWYAPDPRAVLPLDEAFHVSRTLRRLVRREAFDVSTDSDFESVIRLCAEPAPDRPTTWITPEVARSYIRLHKLGHAHSVECWLEGELVGGLYGVALGGAFFGESMFSRERDASKVALVHLVEVLRRGGFQLLDVQFMTDHLARFGAFEIPRSAYLRRLEDALAVPARWPEAPSPFGHRQRATEQGRGSHVPGPPPEATNR